MFPPHLVVCVCHVCGKLFELKTAFISSPLAFDVITADGKRWSLPCHVCGSEQCKAQLAAAWEDPRHEVWRRAGIAAQDNARQVTIRPVDLGTAWAGHKLEPVANQGGLNAATV